MRAIPVSFQVSVNFECCHCGSILTLYNRQIPSRIGMKHRCDGCRKFVDIPVMDVHVDTSSLEEKPLVQEDKSNKAGVVKVLKNYGYKSDEIKQMLSVITDFSQDQSVLLKIALASKED